MPNNTQAVTEAELQDKCSAPRVTLEALQSNIVGEYYFTADDGVIGAHRVAEIGIGRGDNDLTDYRLHQDLKAKHAGHRQTLSLLTFCVLVLKNGFTVTGESACADPANFDADLGRRLARKQAEGKIWPLMGYELRSQLASQRENLAALDMLSKDT